MRTYQNIIIDGHDFGHSQRKKNSGFCNEGKWKNFIEPLLPQNSCEGMTFVEFGCNAGLFLKLATDRGFTNVVGIDHDMRTLEFAGKYLDQFGINPVLFNTLVGRDFDYTQLPLADVTLMSNFHYYLQKRDFFSLIDKMRHKTRYVLIVSAEATMSSLTRASSHLSDIRHYFREWEEVAYIPQIPTDGDPYPRDLFGILFKSPYLDRMDIEELWRIKTPEKFELSIIELVRGLIKEGKDFDIKKIDYFTKVKERVPDEDELDGYIGTHVDSILDVLKNGMKEPVLITKSKRVIDGKHRVVTMKELGHKSIIVQYE